MRPSSEYQISDVERGHLIALGQLPGFQVLINICESEVEQFKVDMINANPTDIEDIRSKHNLALAAATFWKRVAKRINHEQAIFGAQSHANDIVPDVTESMFT
jgi:hypothetical protein